jgi:ribosome-associated heat shock protein Hsp15
MTAAAGEAMRVDRWLFFARFFKTRGLAAKVCAAGKLRIDGRVIDKPHAQIRIGVVLTFPQARQVRVVKVLGLGARRGPPAEAQALYEDLSDDTPVPPPPRIVAARPVRGGRGLSGADRDHR